MQVPLATTFHTLARVKAENGDPEPERRALAEASVMAHRLTVMSQNDVSNFVNKDLQEERKYKTEAATEKEDEQEE